MGFRVIQAADGSKPEEKKGGFRIIQPAAKSGKAAGPVFDPVKDALRGLSTFTDSVGRSMDNLSAGKPTRWADNPALTAPAALLQAITGQVTGPASRALATYGPRAYERPAAPWGERFGQAPRQLSGDEAAQAIEGDLNSALMGLRAVPGAAKPLPARVAKPLEPDVRAARAIERARARDRLVGEVPQAAPGAMPIHQGGESLTELADVLANSPGPGRGVIRRAVRDYEDAAVNRTKGDIARDLGGRDDYFDTLDATMASRALAAEPARQRAFAAPIDPAAFGAEISPLMSRVPKKAINYAMEIARRDGVNPNDLGIEMVRVPGKPTSETVTEMVKERVPGEASAMSPSNARFALRLRWKTPSSSSHARR